MGGGVGLAGALLLLERRRRAQQRHRRSGRVVPLPPDGLRTDEGRLRWGADVAGARLVDVALRAAAAGAGATGVPPLRWVEAAPDLVTLVLVSPSPGPPGFAEVQPDRWVSTATVDALGAAASHASAPAPALVPIGSTEDGTELLVDLELAPGPAREHRPRALVALLLGLAGDGGDHQPADGSTGHRSREARAHRRGGEERLSREGRHHARREESGQEGAQRCPPGSPQDRASVIADREPREEVECHAFTLTRYPRELPATDEPAPAVDALEHNVDGLLDAPPASSTTPPLRAASPIAPWRP